MTGADVLARGAALSDEDPEWLGKTPQVSKKTRRRLTKQHEGVVEQVPAQWTPKKSIANSFAHFDQPDCFSKGNFACMKFAHDPALRLLNQHIGRAVISVTGRQRT